MPIIDSHVHFWKLERGDYGWIPQDRPVLYRDYLPEQLSELLESSELEAVIAVQAASSVAETEYLLQLADRFPWIAGVVGWMNLTSSDFPAVYKHLSRHAKFKGVRISGEELPAAGEENGSRVLASLHELNEGGSSVDLLIRPQHLERAAVFMERTPELLVSINHLGVPPISEEDPAMLAIWKEGIQRLAQLPNAVCKLSGMITREKNVSRQVLKQRVAFLAEVFGAERLMFGSDWPVCLQEGGYAEVVELFGSVCPDHWGEKEAVLVQAENARRFYRLHDDGRKGSMG